MKNVFLPRNWTHCGIFGTTNTGKSTVSELICELMYHKGYKIIDLANDRTLEACGFMRPTRKAVFRNFMKNNLPKDQQPKAIPLNIYHPLVTTIPKRLPPCFNLYTLPLDFFSYENILRIITNDSMSDPSYVSLSEEIDSISKSDSFPAISSKIYGTLNKKILKTKGMNVDLFFPYDSTMSGMSASRPLIKAKSLGLFSSNDFDQTLSDKRILEMLKDRKHITAFSNRFMNQKFKNFKLAQNLYILMKIRDLAKKSGGNILVYIREARTLFPNRKKGDKASKVLCDEAEDMIKECRKSGVKLLLDTQEPDDLQDGVISQVSTQIIHRIDRKESDILETFKGSPGLRNRNTIKAIKTLPDHRFFISHPGVPENPLSGYKLKFKFTDHLEKNEDELRLISKTEPKETWYNTSENLELLRENWLKTAQKYKGIEMAYNSDNENAVARAMRLSKSQLRIIKVFHKEGDQPYRQVYLQKKAKVAKSSIHDSINDMVEANLLKILKTKGKKEILLTQKGRELLHKNKNLLDREEKVSSS